MNTLLKINLLNKKDFVIGTYTSIRYKMEFDIGCGHKTHGVPFELNKLLPFKD